MGAVGAGIIGRRMFDVTGGWGGNPPGGRDARYFVLTHSVPREWVGPDSPFTFVTDGIESASAPTGDSRPPRRETARHPAPKAHPCRPGRAWHSGQASYPGPGRPATTPAKSRSPSVVLAAPNAAK